MKKWICDVCKTDITDKKWLAIDSWQIINDKFYCVKCYIENKEKIEK